MSNGSTPRLRALIISHEDATGAGFVETRLIERGLDVHMHVVLNSFDDPTDTNAFPNREDFDLVVVMGSHWSVYDTESIGSWIGNEIELIRSAHHADQPVLGICFGGQALSLALGGEVRQADTTELGWFEITPTTDEFPVPTGPWLEWHHDCFTVPDGAELMAVTEHAPQMYRLGRSVGTQFHPEINVALLTEWLVQAPDDYLASHGVTRDKLLDDVAHHEAANRLNCFALVDWFLDDVAELELPAVEAAV